MNNEKRFMSTREAYGEILKEIGKRNENIIVLDADVPGSTKTIKFAEKYPERFFNVGIAEQNMIGIASGLALCGKIPFASTFAMFSPGRCYDQIRNTVAASNLNVKIVSTHAGITVGADGVSHQAIEDIAMMRSLPNMKVFVPADAIETKETIKYIVDYEGPVYVRLSRMEVPIIFDKSYRFEMGKGVVLTKGSDATIFATGIMVSEALSAADTLRENGIKTRVIDIHTIKPIDEKIIVKAAKETKIIVTAEDHNIIGGLGSAIAEILAEKSLLVKMKRIGVRKFAESGRPEELMKKYGLSSEHIVNTVKELLKML